MFREAPSTDPASAGNPSFSHGEGWIESGTSDGRRAPGEAAGPDRDADRGFSAWSGRIRGRGATFSLRIVSEGGRIPVNSPSPGLAPLLNNLGARLLPDATNGWIVSGSKREDVPAGIDSSGDGKPDGEWIQCSRLGTDLVAARPPGGYRSLDAVRQAMSASGYAAADIAKAVPYLGLERGASSSDVLVELATAPLPLLESLWMYVEGTFTLPPGESATYDNRFTRSGPANLTFGQTGLLAIVYPDEAAQLAAEADFLRRERRYGWRDLRARFLDAAGTIFSRDVADLGAANVNALTPVAQAAWARAKADLAFAIAASAPPPYAPSPSIWSTLGADFDVPAASPTQPLAVLKPDSVKGLPAPILPGWGWPIGWNSPYRDSLGQPLGRKLTMAAPSLFIVDAAARTASGARTVLSGALRAFERIELSTQEDFERLQGGGSLWKERGIALIDPAPTTRRAALPDLATGRVYVQAVTYPMSNPSRVAAKPFSATHGGIALAGREPGPMGALQYWAFPEDLDGDPSDDGLSESPTAAYSLGPLTSAGPWMFDSKAGWCNVQPPGLTSAVNWVQGGGIFNPGTGVFVDGASIELWISPLAGGASLVARVMPADNESGLIRSIDFRAARKVVNGEPGTSFELKVEWSTGPPSQSPDLEPPYDVFIPDFDPATGRVQTGHHHVVITFKARLVPPVNTNPEYRTRIRLYVNGKEPPSIAGGRDLEAGIGYPAQRMIADDDKMSVQVSMVDELRMYDRELTGTDVEALWRLGRFASPVSGPAADLLGSPVNPTYRSPGLDLGPGAALRRGGYVAWMSKELSGKVGVRAQAYGFDGAGAPVAERMLEPDEASTDLSFLSPIRSFRFAVEFYSPTGGPADPLYDTPVAGPFWFTFTRRGRAPAWSAWETR